MVGLAGKTLPDGIRPYSVAFFYKCRLLFPLLLGFDVARFQKLIYAVLLFTETFTRLKIQKGRHFKLKYYYYKTAIFLFALDQNCHLYEVT